MFGPGNTSAPRITVASNGRYLLKDGRPIFLIGDSPHPLMANLSLADAEYYFQNRHENGFNCHWIEVVLTDYIAGGRSDWSLSDTTTPFTTTVDGTHYDLTAPRETYFQKIDAIVQAARSYEQIILMEVWETGNGQATFTANGSSRATTWGQFLGNRYKGYWNIIWLVGNDNNRDTAPDATQSTNAKAVMDGIYSVDKNHLISTELQYFMSGSLDNATMRVGDSLTLAGAYSYFPNYYEIYQQYSVNNPKPIPVFFEEGFYEDATGSGAGLGTALPPSRRVLRMQAYHTPLAGGLGGHIYGNHYVDFSGNASGFSTNWKTDINTAGLPDLRRFGNFVNSKNWWTLQPDASHVMVTAGYGTASGNNTGSYDTDTYCTCAADSLTGNATLMVCYCPVATTLTVDLSKFRQNCTARWFDPTNGSYTGIAGSPFNNTGTLSAKNGSSTGVSAVNNSAGDADWVLVVEYIGPADYSYPYQLPEAAFGVRYIQPTLPVVAQWTTEIAGFYWISESTGTDTGRTYGTPFAPRATVPTSLAAGSKVVVTGSYTHDHTGGNKFVLSGTSANPITILNVGTWTGAIQVTGSYTVIEGGVFFSLVVIDTSDHITLRDFEVNGLNGAGGIGVAQFGAGSLNQIVCLNLNIHDTGHSDQTATNADYHGITVNWGSNIFVLDCRIARCEGDGIQIAAGNSGTGFANSANVANVIGVYIGRTVSHDNQQHGMWCKYATLVVFSENECYGHTANQFGIGAQIGTQYGPVAVGVLHGYLHSGERGFGAASYGTAGDVSLSGVRITNITSSTATLLDVNAGGSAFFFAGGTNLTIDKCVVEDCTSGVLVPAGPTSVTITDTSLRRIALATLNYESAGLMVTQSNDTTDHPWQLVIAGVDFPQA